MIYYCKKILIVENDVFYRVGDKIEAEFSSSLNGITYYSITTHGKKSRCFTKMGSELLNEHFESVNEIRLKKIKKIWNY